MDAEVAGAARFVARLVADTGRRPDSGPGTPVFSEWVGGALYFPVCVGLRDGKTQSLTRPKELPKYIRKGSSARGFALYSSLVFGSRGALSRRLPTPLVGDAPPRNATSFPHLP